MAVAVLLRHCATNRPRRFQGILSVDPHIGGTVPLNRTFNHWLAGFAERVIVNIDVVIAHAGYPLLK